jgi:hypothetical protein
MIIRFWQCYPTYPTKYVDKEFIQSDSTILSILSDVTVRDIDKKHLFSLTLRFCQCYPIYHTIDVDTEFNHSET